MIDADAAYLNGITFQNLYAEILFTIGVISFSASYQAPVRFQSCVLKFTAQGDISGVTTTVLDCGSAPGYVSFEDCFFASLPDVFVANAYGYNGNIIFNRCVSQFTSEYNQASIPIYKAVALNACGGFICSWPVAATGSTITYHAYDNVTGLTLGIRKINTTTADGLSLGIPSTTIQVPQYNGTTSYSPYEFIGFNINVSLLVSITLVNKTLTIELPGAYTDSIQYKAGKPGDIIVENSTLTTFFIRSRTANVIIAQMQNNYISDGSGGFNTIVPFSLSSGVLFVSNSRLFTPSVQIYGTLTSGSPVITDVSNTSGFGTDIVVGTQLVVRSELFAFKRTEVISYDAGAATITLNGNAASSATKIALPIWVSLPPANV